MNKDVNPYAEADFSWAQWTPNTSLKLCNVTWDASYRDVVRFVSRETQTAYFDSLDGVTCAPGTMHKPTQPVLVEMAFNEASNWNYLVAYNDYPQLETPRRWFYFIQSVEYVNAHTTRLYLMLDVWQSFQSDITVGSSYVVRGHIGVANENQWQDYGRTYLALPEGLDTGSEMVTASQSYKSLISTATDSSIVGSYYDYGVVVVSTTNLGADPGSESEPSLSTAGGSMFENMANGTDVYYCDGLPAFLHGIMERGSTYPWVTQGICAIYMVPRIPQDYLNAHASKVPNLFGQSNDWNIYRFSPAVESSLRYEDYRVAQNFRNLFNVPQRYRNLRKLFTYPYCAIECTCLNGTSIIYRPEDIQDDDFVIRMTYNLAPNGSRINFYPPDYNAAGAQTITPAGGNAGLPIDGGEMLESSFGISNLPQFCVVNNGGALALANTAYTREYQQSQASWAYQKAQMGTLQASQATTLANDMRTQSNNLAIGNRNAVNAIQAQQINKSLDITTNQLANSAELQRKMALGNTIMGVGSAVAGGNVASGIQSVVGYGMSDYSISNSQAISNITNSANTANQLATNAAMNSQANTYGTSMAQLQNENARAVTDMNNGYALAAASGDYRQSIAGINAQVQQMALTPPTTSGALGGDGFNLANGIVGFLVRFKTCAPSALAAVGEYMLRYGYFVQRFVTPPASLMCMTHFTYWQMQECYIRGTLPEQYRLTIKGMFEAGVTVWANADDIGVLDWADNDPLSGISY